MIGNEKHQNCLTKRFFTEFDDLNTRCCFHNGSGGNEPRPAVKKGQIKLIFSQNLYSNSLCIF